MTATSQHTRNRRELITMVQHRPGYYIIDLEGGCYRIEKDRKPVLTGTYRECRDYLLSVPMHPGKYR
jgi:hypothetical protein